MTVSEAEFKSALSRFATGVTVLTTCDGDQPAGLTVNAFASISLHPPLVMVSIDTRSHLHDLTQRTGYFAVNILGAHQHDVSRRFAGQTADRDHRFAGTTYHAGLTGAPLLDEAIAHVECRLVAVYPGGDHSIFLGSVEAVDSLPGDPMIYYRSRYGAFEADADVDAGVAPGRRE